MKKLLLLLLFPFALNAQDVAKNADQFLTAYNQQDLFTGNVLIAQKGKVLFSKSYGLANRESNVKNTLETSFRIGSISKSFTAVVILQLQQEGLLNVEDKLSKYFPEYPKADSIKLINLLSNTSGIPDFIFIKGLYPWTKFNNYKELIPVFSAKPLLFTPGTKFNYSSSNFLLLCAIAEKVTGKEYNTLLNEKIVKKLKLKNTGMDYMDRKDAKKAIGYESSLNDFYAKATNVNIGVLSGAGGMYSTVNDMLAFDRALYTDKLLNEESKKLMYTIVKDEYALGWEITKENGKKVIGHAGSIDGFKANLLRYPDNETVVISLSNYSDIQGFELYNGLKQISQGDKFEVPVTHKFIAISADELKDYEGDFYINDKISLKMRLDSGKLMADLPGSTGTVIYPEAKDVFYFRLNNAYAKFSRDADGKINAVQIAKGTRVSTWKKK